MEISKDSYATLLLCSDLALGGDTKAYTSIQWNKLAEKLWRAELSPQALFDIDKIKETIQLSEEESERINRLLDRAGQFGVALSSLNEKGIYTLTKSDSTYPKKLREKLGKYAPPVLYYAGNLNILENRGVAIVGSRNIEMDAMEFAEELARKCADAGVNIVSGGARGVDSVAENTSNSVDGTSLIFMADSLEKKIRSKDTRTAIMRHETLVMSAQRPDMPFAVYTAMERNKYIYAMADYVVAVSSDANKGGTWRGAVENLKYGWTPLFIRESHTAPKGNKKLLEMDGTSGITEDDLKSSTNIFDWFGSNISQASYETKSEKVEVHEDQLSMFDLNMIAK
jgi:predicted Rossmann fold nucleotide-binding protein DprA/Smf involved in DNA uptake